MKTVKLPRELPDLLMGDYSEELIVYCPKCRDNGKYCDLCEGDGHMRIIQSVSCRTVKKIYSDIVDKFEIKG